MKRATEHLGDCEDTNCPFCTPKNIPNSTKEGPGHMCCNGMRNIGCDQIPNKDAELRKEEILLLAKMEGEDIANEYIKNLAERRQSKAFNFVFQGHEYTASDSARTQNACPHCGNSNPSGLMFSEHSPNVTFLGEKYFGDHTAQCFSCNICHEKFFYHL